MSHSLSFDTLILGGGPAGLSAALYLGRSRKRVAVLDAGTPRHAVSKAVHNFLSRDGISPADLRAQSWAQMKPYTTVEHVPGVYVVSLEHHDERWHATLSTGEVYTAPTVLLALGLVDEHPDIPGFENFWAHSIHHCPYCHGWEMRDLPLAVLGHGDYLQHMPPLLRGWSSDVVVLTDGEPIAQEVLSGLVALDIPVHTSKITQLTGHEEKLRHIHFADGTTLERHGMFLHAAQRPVALVESLDLEMNGTFVVVDAFQRTSAPNLWAAGDICAQMQQVVTAASQGGLAGAMINMTLTTGSTPAIAQPSSQESS